MATVTLPFQNPHVKLEDEVIDINYRSKKYRIAIENISKIYLSKRKTGYLTGLFGSLLMTRNQSFKLYIHTKDNGPITIDIADFEKYYFVALISWVRNRVKPSPTNSSFSA